MFNLTGNSGPGTGVQAAFVGFLNMMRRSNNKCIPSVQRKFAAMWL